MKEIKMLLLLYVGITLIVHLDAKGTYQTEPPVEDPVYCYDCHYDPDADKEAYDSPEAGRYPGYPKCALNAGVDEGRVDKWPCKTGKCFIRRDPNGLVYRGCADPWNLPWGVDDSKSCEYQPEQKPSLWWFCDGDKCNGGLFGQGDICADPPALPYNDDSYVETVHGDNPDEGYPGDGDSYGGKSYKQESYGKKSYAQPQPKYEQKSTKYQPPAKKSKSYEANTEPPKSDYGKKSGYGSKGKEGSRGVDVYGIYTAEVAPMHPKKSLYPAQVQAYDPWMIPYDSSYQKHGFPENYDKQNGYNSKKSDYGKKPVYEEPKSKKYQPQQKQPSKSVEPKPHYKSEKPKVQPPSKSAPSGKSVPQYKSQQPSTKSVPHYKSMKSQPQPSKSSSNYKSQPSKSNYGGYNKYQQKKPSMSDLPEPVKKPSKSYKPKPFTQPVDYVHGVYNQENQQQVSYDNSYDKQDGIYDEDKASYDSQVNEGYNLYNEEPVDSDQADTVYEPYTQQQPDQSYGSAQYGAKSGYEGDKYNSNYGDSYGQGYGQGNGYDNVPSTDKNPCDGKCKNNPSGLFSHPNESDWFIQCGSGMEYGKTCKCCKPYYLRCPRGATFDVTTRVCSRMTGDYGNAPEEPKYKPVKY